MVAEPESNTGEAQEDLLDLSEDGKPQHKALQRAQSHNQMPSANGSPPGSTPASRRQSAPRRTSSLASVAKDGNPKHVTNHDHFHRLGPSNLASRPRQTRYNTVKIKPGGGSLAENIQKVNESANSGSPLAISAVSPAPHGGVGTGLLSSAGKDASDGVLAVQQGYGTMSGTPPKSPGKANTTGSGGQSATSQAHPAATIQEEEQEPHLRSKSGGSATSNHRSDSESTIGSLHKPNRSTSRVDVSPRQKRGTARSGSITEQIVDTGGIRKVVLETTSSSEEAGNNSGPQTNKETANQDAQNAGSSNSSGGGKGDGDGGGVPLDARDEGETSPSKKGGGKKKRRRKTRKGGSAKGKGEGDENEPLLEEREEN